MNWNPICTNPTKAARRYQQRMGMIMLQYLVITFGVSFYVHREHPQGLLLYAAACLPVLPVIGIMLVVGRYLKEEIDEFKRYQVVRSLLWAMGSTLVLIAAADFLRSFAAMPPLPPFVTFVCFWLVMAVAQAIQAMQNRVRDEEQAA